MKSINLIFAMTVLMISQFATASVISISDVTASSTLTGLDANNLINGYGLNGDLHKGNKKMKWLAAKNDMPSLIFDLGSIINIAGTEIWNFGSKRSSKNILIESSIDGINFDLVAGINLAKAPRKNISAELFEFNTIARYMRFDIQSNYGNRYAGLSEVQFFDQPADVPEPATFILLALGLVGLKRRKIKG